MEDYNKKLLNFEGGSKVNMAIDDLIEQKQKEGLNESEILE